MSKKLSDIFGDSASGARTLEFRDDPEKSFMRQLEKEIDRDPEEALRIAKRALTDKLFSPALEAKILTKMSDILDSLHKDKEHELSLSGAFMKSVFNIVPQPEAAQPAPPAPAAPTPGMGGPQI